MRQVTFECDGPFRGDTGPKFVFFTEGCQDYVAFHAPDGNFERYTLEQFVKIMHQAKRQRERKGGATDGRT